MSDTSEAKDDEGIRVICAGLGRTGTLSLTEALTTLGYKPYHFVKFQHHAEWAEFSNGTKYVDDMIDLMVREGYTATLENPTSDIYQELLRKYPNAKVVLTVRDTPEKFVKSWKTLFDTMTITEQRFSWRFPSFLGYIPHFSNLYQIRQFMGTTHLGLERGALTHGWRAKGDDWLAEQYQRHNQHVQDNVAKDRLLVFNVKEGWEPLCQFLELPVPKEHFPYATMNNTEGLIKLRRAFLMIVYGWIPTLTIVVGIGVCAWGGHEDNICVGSRVLASCTQFLRNAIFLR